MPQEGASKKTTKNGRRRSWLAGFEAPKYTFPPPIFGVRVRHIVVALVVALVVTLVVTGLGIWDSLG